MKKLILIIALFSMVGSINSQSIESLKTDMPKVIKETQILQLID